PTLTVAGQALAPTAPPGSSDLLPGLGAQNKPIRLQLDSGTSVWCKIQFVWADSGAALATVYIFNQALSPFVTDKEYWYVNKSGLSKLGTAGINISVTDESSMTAPSDPGYASEQKFGFVQNLSWGTGWTTDPLSGSGSLYDGPDNFHLRVNTS